MDNRNQKKQDQLGMPIGTATNRLKKSVLFSLLKKLDENICFQCNQVIDLEDDLSIEHKIPWLDSQNPVEMFFDLDNIAFSHLSCNIGSARRTFSKHGTVNRYFGGCRCKECTQANTKSCTAYRKRKKNKRL